MFDMISQLATDRTWVYTSIAGSILGALFIAYMRDTKIGLWLYSKWDLTLDTLRDKFGWTWLDQPVDAWRTKYPYVTKKLDELEARLTKLEDRTNGN